MMTSKLIRLAAAGLMGATLLSGCNSMPIADTAVVEVVTFKLKPGVTAEEFRPLDQEVERQYAMKQPGFVSREAAAGDKGEWLVIVHWRSAQDADASMAGFASAPAAAPFMSKIDSSSFSMKRYARSAP